MEENKTVYNYYLIFKRTGDHTGEFVCLAPSEEVGMQFCKDFPGYYCLRRDQFINLS